MSNSNIIRGSHNTFTYLKPKNVLHYLGIPFAKCQSKGLAEQIKEGIRAFDIRPRFTKKGELKLCHGLFEVKVEEKDPKRWVQWLFGYLPSNDRCILRLILETGKEDKKQEEYFCNFCSLIQAYISSHNLPHLIIGGNRKYDWKQIYTNVSYLPEYQHTSSTGKWYEDNIPVRWYERILPWVYARRTNKGLQEKIDRGDFGEGTVLLYDFV